MGRDEDSGDGDRRRGRDGDGTDALRNEGDERGSRSRRSSPGHESRHRRRHRSQGRRRRSRTPDTARTDRSSDYRDRRRDRSRQRERRYRRTGDNGDYPRGQDGSTGDEPVPRRRQGPLPSQADSFAVVQGDKSGKAVVKETVNYGNTGLLAAAANTVVSREDGASMVTLKYHEPAEARKPSPRDQWKLYVFKGADVVDTVDLSSRSCWLIGRETAVVDFVAEHPSISKQHAVVQFRYREKRNELGDKVGQVKPYLIDLESANGTMLNHDKVPDSRYLELRDKDMVQFGQSTREYVIMLAPRN